jgi:hypothetical protein
MRIKFGRLGAAAAVAAIAATGMVAMASPASAAFTDCPNNSVCLWAGAGASSTLLFVGNGTTMASNPDFYYSDALRAHPHAFSSNNTTRGRFCTYDSNFVRTNTLNAGTRGNISGHNTNWVAFCP